MARVTSDSVSEELGELKPMTSDTADLADELGTQREGSRQRSSLQSNSPIALSRRSTGDLLRRCLDGVLYGRGPGVVIELVTTSDRFRCLFAVGGKLEVSVISACSLRLTGLHFGSAVGGSRTSGGRTF